MIGLAVGLLLIPLVIALLVIVVIIAVHEPLAALAALVVSFFLWRGFFRWIRRLGTPARPTPGDPPRH